MSILVNKSSKVVIQGITGSEGKFHGEQMLDYGTNIVSGVTPGKGGIKTLNESVPVFNSVEEAVEETEANTSIIFACFSLFHNFSNLELIVFPLSSKFDSSEFCNCSPFRFPVFDIS